MCLVLHSCQIGHREAGGGRREKQLSKPRAVSKQKEVPTYYPPAQCLQGVTFPQQGRDSSTKGLGKSQVGKSGYLQAPETVAHGSRLP